MKPFNFLRVGMFDCPKCGACAPPDVKYTSVAESPPTAPFLWIECKTCGYGEHMKTKDD
jgi:predicted nucleic-acid-binding Zn-ribbon protein